MGGTAVTAITLTLPLTGTAGGLTTINTVVITGDNTGTLIVDHASQCWQKTNYRGDPHEFGAVGDGATNDTVPMQNWLGAYGAPGSTNTAPNALNLATNFGPWIATIPANYQVLAPLVCPPLANLQAPANITSGTPNNGSAPEARP